jgi:hypothetical protein
MCLCQDILQYDKIRILYVVHCIEIVQYFKGGVIYAIGLLSYYF